MKNNGQLSQDKIQKISFDILKQSKSLGVFPTPVDEIVQYAELTVSNEKYIENIPNNYLTRKKETLKKALRKVNGILDRKEKTIYVDTSQIPVKQKFIKLHEVGHEVLPWQRDLYEIIEDDDHSLGAEIKDEFEIEANLFASEALFQGEYFFEFAKKLPLEIGSPIALAHKFGASIHSAMRKYVEISDKRCALLVLKDPSCDDLSCMTRNYFNSASFEESFGRIYWNSKLTVEWPFVQDYLSTKKMHKKGFFQYVNRAGSLYNFDYHYFHNKYNGFVFIIPVGEVKKSRTKILIKQ